MECTFPNLTRLAASAVVLISIMPSIANATDCHCRESHGVYRLFNWSRYQREADHRLIRYPNATYWSSGDDKEQWGDADTSVTDSTQIAPSPWSYNSIAPLASQYHFFYGDNGCFDCRN